MNRFFFAGMALGAVVAAAGSAQAADLPFKAAPQAVAPAPAYDWSGIYIGAHVGGGWATNDLSDPSIGFLGLVGLTGIPVVQTTDSSGILGGVQAGWNYQIGRFVLGTELDFSWADVNGTSTSTFAPGIAGPGTSISRSLTADTNWIGTSTVRLGYAHDRWMFYSKAGVAYDHTKYTSNWVGNGAGGAAIFAGTGSKTQVGWTVGFGAEWAFWNNWSAKLEYDFMDFGSKTIPINGVIGPGTANIPASFGVVNEQTISEVKFGLNYKFMGLLW
jgi:outer membrane immunogenic protein